MLELPLDIYGMWPQCPHVILTSNDICKYMHAFMLLSGTLVYFLIQFCFLSDDTPEVNDDNTVLFPFFFIIVLFPF